MTNWNTYKLEEVISNFIDYRGKTPPKVSSGIPLITAKVVKGGTINEPNEFVPEAIYDKWMTRGIPEYGDVLLTTEAPLGEVAQLNFKQKVVVGQRLITLRGKSDKLDNTYLKYSLQTKEMQARLEAVATGTTVIGIKSAELRKVEIDLPDLHTQRRIAEILSALDDKIELNRRMNQTLEQMAQTLFRQYFVDSIDQENQEPISLLDFADLIGGGTPKTSVKEYWDGDILWVSAKDVTPNDGTFIVETEKKITALGLSKSSAKLIPHFSTIITARGTVGKLCIASSEMTISQSNYALKTKGKNADFVLFQIIQHQIQELQRNSYGTVFDTITTNTLRDIKITVPAQDKVLELEEKIKPLYLKILANLKENITLSRTRDSLLPKLMSGEIDVMQIKPEELHEPVLS